MDIDVRCEIKTTVCRHSVSNANEAQALFERIARQAYSPEFRKLIIIETAFNETAFNAEAVQWRKWTAEHIKHDFVVLDKSQYRDRSDELTQILGSEFTTAVYCLLYTSPSPRDS